MNRNLFYILLSAAILLGGCNENKTIEPPKDGIKKWYHANGVVSQTAIYKNNKLNGVSKIYGNDGTLQREIPYTNGKKNGVEKIWGYVKYPGKEKYLSQTITYVNGERHGPQSFYHINGKKNGKDYEYINGEIRETKKKKGTVKSYYANGKIKEVEKYDKNGELHGVQKGWHQNGKLHYIVTFTHGVKHGRYISYLSDGSIFERGTYVNGRLKLNPTAKDRELKKRKRALKSKVQTQKVSLQCKFDGGHASMSEMLRKEAVAKGQGEGAALGYMMKNNNSIPGSYQEARNICTRYANGSGMSCDYAEIYLSSCMHKFGL